MGGPLGSRRFVVPATLAGRRLDHVLDELCVERTRAQLQKLVRRGRVRVDGKKVVRSNVSVAGKAEITLEGDAETGAPASLELRVVHEDEHLLVVDKPAGMLTYPTARSSAGSVSAELERRFGSLPTPFGEERPGIVHRLDRETSGVLVVGRDEQTMRALQSLFRHKRVAKLYLALVSHVPPTGSVTIDEPMGPVPGKLDRQRVASVGEGKPASTEVECLESFGRHALVACRPQTGRRHQIRVHLAHRGWPVLGDPLYGTRRAVPLPDGAPPLRRQALHAHRLSFRHPGTGEDVAFEAALHADLEAVLQHLRS